MGGTGVGGTAGGGLGLGGQGAVGRGVGGPATVGRGWGHRETVRREVLMFCTCEHSQSVATSLSLKQVTTHEVLGGFFVLVKKNHEKYRHTADK